MKVADIRAMTLDQMEDEVLKLKEERFNLRFQRATGQLENTARVRIVRRDIARLKTIVAQKRAGSPEPAVTQKPKTETTPKAAKPKAAKSETEMPKKKPQSAKSRKAGAKKGAAAKSKSKE